MIAFEVGVGHLELPAVDQVAARRPAGRAGERVKLVHLLSGLARRAPDLGGDEVKVKASASQSSSGGRDRPGALEGRWHSSAECAHPQADRLDSGVRFRGRLLNGVDHGTEQAKFVHGPMMAARWPVGSNLACGDQIGRLALGCAASSRESPRRTSRTACRGAVVEPTSPRCHSRVA